MYKCFLSLHVHVLLSLLSRKGKSNCRYCKLSGLKGRMSHWIKLHSVCRKGKNLFCVFGWTEAKICKTMIPLLLAELLSMMNLLIICYCSNYQWWVWCWKDWEHQESYPVPGPCVWTNKAWRPKIGSKFQPQKLQEVTCMPAWTLIGQALSYSLMVKILSF